MISLSPELLISLIGTIVALIGIPLSFYVLKKPHLSFKLKKVELSLFNEVNEEKRLSMLIARVNNERKFYLGDTAKNATACLLYRGEIPGDKSVGLNASTGLPWLKSCSERNKVDLKLETKDDVLNALEQRLFEREENDIPQGRTCNLVVAFGIEGVNKMFLASEHALELSFPPKDKPNQLTSCFLNLEIAGENFPSKYQDGTVLILKNWNEWTFPIAVHAVRTPSIWKNMLLRIGVGKKQRVIPVESSKY